MAVDLAHVAKVGEVLNNPDMPLAERFRALFTLKNLKGKEAIDCINECFRDESELLKHECAYCLGQMQDTHAVPTLMDVLKDKKQQVMVRHEAGEALGAIGSKEALQMLEDHCNDSHVEVAETCQLAVQRIQWLNSSEKEREQLSDNPFASVDPAPPSEATDVPALKEELLDENLPLFKRYRAMFSLRNLNTEDSVLALAEGLKCKGALFKHEIAYVLGQMQHEAAITGLSINLKDAKENAMVRHECAEALGSIATDECIKILEEYAKDNERVVKESCVVALDMCEYEKSGQFQYADTLGKVEAS